MFTLAVSLDTPRTIKIHKWLIEIEWYLKGQSQISNFN